MFEKPLKEPGNAGKKFKKVVAGITAAGLAMGAAEKGFADTGSKENQDKKTLEEASPINHAQSQRESIEKKFGIKIVMPDDSVTQEQGQEQKEKNAIDLKKDFDLGVKSKDIEADYLKTWVKEISRRFKQDYLMHQESIDYKEEALKQIIAKYGEQRACKVFEILENTDPKERKGNHHQFALSLPYLDDPIPNVKEKINKILYIIADLMEEGNAEKLGELFELLQKEGYSKSYKFDWDIEKINELINDPEERKALIEFGKKVSGLLTSLIEKKTGLSKEEFTNLSYKERMKIFESLKTLGIIDARIIGS